MGTLKKTFIKGISWTVSENIILTITGLVQLYVTSHVLTPVDFGIYAIAMFFYSLGRIAFSMGFGPALIQRRGDITNCINTAWTAGIIMATMASIILSLLVPVINDYFYHEDKATIPSIVMLFGCVLAAGANPALVFLQREVQLKKIFFLNVIPKILSFAILLLILWINKSYWGLIFALISEYLFRGILSYIFYPYFPHFELNKKIFRELYAFGGWLQIKNIASWLSSNIDVAVVGNILGPVNLGFYNRAQSISAYPRSFLDSVVNAVAFPIYTKVYDNKNQFYNIVNKIQDLTLIFISIIILEVILYGEQLVQLVLGEQWAYLVLPFQLLLVAYMMQALIFSFNPILRSFGKTKLEFWFYVFFTIIILMFLYPCCRQWQLVGAGIAILFASCLTFPLYLYIISKTTQLPIAYFFKSFIISAFSILITFGSMIFFESHMNIHWLLGCFLSMLYLILVLVFISGFIGGPGKTIITAILKNSDK